jgi:hypothetical protein
MRRRHVASVDWAQFSGPIVDVLKNMVVNRLKVGGVKATTDWRCLKLGNAKHR